MPESSIMDAKMRPTSVYSNSEEVETKTLSKNLDGEPRDENEKNGSTERPLDFLQRALTTRSEVISYQDPGPPPDGGVKAWLQGTSIFKFPEAHIRYHLENYHFAGECTNPNTKQSFKVT